MKTEIEAKFDNINLEEMRARLAKIGAVLIQPETLTRSKIYEHPTLKDHDWFRVRDEGKRITMSYKKQLDRTLHGMQEISFEVPSFEDACAFIESTHVKFVSSQEKKREEWNKNGVEITIDTWPWIPPFIEIEGSDESSVKKIASELGLNWDDALHGSVENFYMKHYDVTEEEVDDWPEITFVTVPDWLEAKKRVK